jgi:hypothetical protein
VPKYDAFGREIGDDPLAGLQEATNAVPVEEKRATPEPVVATPEPAAARPEPVVAAPAPIQFVRPRRRRGGRGLAGLLVIVAIFGGLGLAANAVVEKSEDLIERVTPEQPEPAPTGLGNRSLVREANFTDAVQTLAKAGLGRPVAIRIAPDRVDATLLEGQKLHQVQITPDGELRELASTQGTGQPMPFSKVDPAAPERLVRAAATKKQPARSIDYVLINAGPPVTTGAYFKRGRIVIGDAHGRVQRVL